MRGVVRKSQNFAKMREEEDIVLGFVLCYGIVIGIGTCIGIAGDERSLQIVTFGHYGKLPLVQSNVTFGNYGRFPLVL